MTLDELTGKTVAKVELRPTGIFSDKVIVFTDGSEMTMGVFANPVVTAPGEIEKKLQEERDRKVQELERHRHRLVSRLAEVQTELDDMEATSDA